jgi:hypothetical protein
VSSRFHSVEKYSACYKYTSLCWQRRPSCSASLPPEDPGEGTSSGVTVSRPALALRTYRSKRQAGAGVAASTASYNNKGQPTAMYMRGYRMKRKLEETS